MPAVSDQVVIIGIGETRVGKLPGLSAIEIQAEAVLAALDDAGVGLHELDGVINLDPYVTPNSMFATTLAEYLGVGARFLSTVDVGGTVSGTSYSCLCLCRHGWDASERDTIERDNCDLNTLYLCGMFNISRA